MKTTQKTIISLLTLLFCHTLPGSAQVETSGTTTTLDATWTEIPEAEASFHGDLHLAGESKVEFVMKNTSDIDRNYSYVLTVEVRGADETRKATAYYRCDNTYSISVGNSSTQWSVSTQENGSYTPLGTGETANGTLTLSNGATGDYLYMSIRRLSGYKVSAILTVLTTTTTRYNLYDHLPLFGIDSGDMPASNRIKDHSEEIDVYVHRTLVGNGGWSTLCLPFDMSHEQVVRSLGSNVVYSEFSDVDLVRKHINFKSTQNGIKAGRPYLIQNNGSNKENFFADNVTFTQESVRAAMQDRKGEKESHGYYFVGLLQPTKVNAEEPLYNPDGRAVYIANPETDGKQQLKRLGAAGTIKAFRAYLVFPTEISTQAKSLGELTIDLDGMLNTPTGLMQIYSDGREVNNRIYNLHGRYVGTDVSLLPSGVYVRNGRKFCVSR